MERDLRGGRDGERCDGILRRVASAEPGVPAWPAVRAVLGTLGEALPFGTAAYLASNLPRPLAEAVGRHFPVDDPVVRVGRRDFAGSVARRCGCPPERVDSVIRAVTSAVAGDVPRGVMVDVEQVTPRPLLDLIVVPASGHAHRRRARTAARSPATRA